MFGTRKSYSIKASCGYMDAEEDSEFGHCGDQQRVFSAYSGPSP
jgi:hypothetical protein